MPLGNADVKISEYSDELQVDGLELNNFLVDDDLLYEDELVALSDEEGESDTVSFLLFDWNDFFCFICICELHSS